MLKDKTSISLISIPILIIKLIIILFNYQLINFVLKYNNFFMSIEKTLQGSHHEPINLI